ncbi:hypothetical protein AX15_007116 [Amanita polypyramis BW_CC]|nr:hypothetical protein AX15_007116 [Amanita polypyramis BW_CC]
MLTITFLSLAAFVLVVPALANVQQKRQGPSPTNLVKINSESDYCIIVPKDSHTNIGDSEYNGGETTYCSAAGRSSPDQGQLSNNFWRNVEYKTGNGVNGESYVQLTGCINPETLDRLDPNDDGGQYDSDGGTNGQGNPQGSVCIGYNNYVELIEPARPRACVRCCIDAADCPVDMDKSGCPTVIPGNYFDCN